MIHNIPLRNLNECLAERNICCIFALVNAKAVNMLFQKNIVKKYLAGLPKEQTDHVWNQFKSYFLNSEIQANILQSKEEQFQEGFLRELFVKVLGYTLNPSPDYNLITEQKKRNRRMAFGYAIRRYSIQMKYSRSAVVDRCKAPIFLPVPDDRFVPHGGGTYPDPAFTVQRAVNDHRFQSFRVPGGKKDLVHVSFEVTVFSAYDKFRIIKVC